MKRFVVAEETKDEIGMEIVDDGDAILLRDIDEIDGISEDEYIVPKLDIPKLIEGLKLFTENGTTREEFIAAVRHIGWVYYQIAANQPYNEIINKDQMESLLNGIKYADEHPDITPEENHNNWMKEKTRQGWVYGPVKDFEKKIHPDLVPFDQLPDI